MYYHSGVTKGFLQHTRKTFGLAFLKASKKGEGGVAWGLGVVNVAGNRVVAKDRLYHTYVHMSASCWDHGLRGRTVIWAEKKERRVVCLWLLG